MSAGSLDRLCAALGVAPQYADADGRRIDVPDESKRAILAALGYPVSGGAADEQAAAHLQRLRESAPSACVVEWSDSGSLPLTAGLPRAWSGRVIRWHLRLETGDQRRGLATAQPSPTDADGTAEDAGVLPLSLTLFARIPPGQHRLTLFPQGGSSGDSLGIDLYVCPPTCFDPEEASGGARLWGPAVHLRTLRSVRDWGIGDFGDLLRLVDLAADSGAHFVGIDPPHALFPHDPGQAGPYNPASREWLNVLHIDVESMRDFSECREARERVESEDFRQRLAALRGQRTIDCRGVAEAKFEVLEVLYRHFRNHHLDRSTQRAGLFRDFQREGGRPLRLHALFEAIQERFHRLDPAVRGWTSWPAAFHDVQGPAVRAFEAENEARIEYYEYLQWQAEGQLQAVAQRCRARGMRVGLYRDVALGAHPGGPETWSRQSLVALDARAGAPADEAHPEGWDWGFPPPLPQQLREGGFAAFLAVLRANMRHAGAVRLAHVASLMRLFWLPRQHPAGQGAPGACVAYPMRELFLLLCLESRRQRCVVIGDDLGDVPAEVREAMDRHGVLSYRPLYLEEEDQGPFRGPWPRRALAAVDTHDLPAWRGSGNGFGLNQDGRLPPGLAVAAYRHVARTPSIMAVAWLEDVLDRRGPADPSGTGESAFPDGFRRLETGVGEIAADPCWQAVAAVMNRERPCPALPLSGGPREFRAELAQVPRATYRLQFNSRFGFPAAEEILPYLAALGVSHIYASPFLKARPGSSHGYDIVDHQSVNPEIGSAEDYRRYCARLAALGLGQVLDIVPNHVGVLGADNEWWLDVLENGQASEHAEHFDIDWDPPPDELRGKVLLPVLGDQYGVVLENGELALDFSPGTGEFSVRYHEHRFPVDPCDYPWILVGEGAAATEDADGFLDEPAAATLLAALRTLPPRDAEAAAARQERQRNAGIFKQQLAGLHERLPAVRARIAARLAALNGRPGDPPSFDALDRLLERQAYRLASWRVAADDINYRRFFDVNDLAALRIEDETVFEATHAQILRWLAEGCVSGLRIDHPDGLSDPAAYFQRLQDSHARRHALPPLQGGEGWGFAEHHSAPSEPAGCVKPALPGRGGDGVKMAGDPREFPVAAPHPPPSLPLEGGGVDAHSIEAMAKGGSEPDSTLYVVVEKIVGEFEPLPDDWPVHGDTGYRFAAFCNSLFVDASQESRFSRIYRAFTGEARNFSDILLESRLLIMAHALSGEVGGLASLLHDIARRDRGTRDFTRSRLRGALVEIVAGFPVYRTYIGSRGISDTDRRYVERAVGDAVRRGLAGDASALHFVRDVILSAPTELSPALREMKLAFVRRFQQFTAPVMAKAMEDTAFYRYNRLVSLNEVGSDPRTFGIEPDGFHAACERLSCTHPFGLLASSTHDSKRSEDVRARINVLSEMPGAWRLALRRWGRLNARWKRRVGRVSAPSANDEYLLYQTLLGVWPFEPADDAAIAALSERVQAYMLKGAREAKQHTSWMNPDEAYETALAGFVRGLLSPGTGRDIFLADFLPFQAAIARFGAFNSLSQLLLKLAAPGVTDIYQGCERWNFSLVDPDNRRPVDFAIAEAQLHRLQEDFPQGPDASGLRALVRDMADGRLKLYVLWRALQARRDLAGAFLHGRYVPLDVSGPAARHVVAFMRSDGRRAVIVVATRLLFTFSGGDPEKVTDCARWSGTLIDVPAQHAGGWRDAFSGRAVAVTSMAGRSCLDMAMLFDALPLALLLPELPVLFQREWTPLHDALHD